MAKLKEEEEELKAELDRERIRREADEQRRRDARRKEEALKRGTTTKTTKNSKHSAQVKEPARAKKVPVKVTYSSQALKLYKDHQAVMTMGGAVFVLGVVWALVLRA